MLTKKASVHLHTYSKSAIKSVTACIDKPLSESDCHARPFKSSPPHPPQTGFGRTGRALLYTLQSYWTWYWLWLAEQSRRKKRNQVACFKSLDIWSDQSVSPVVAMWPLMQTWKMLSIISTYNLFKDNVSRYYSVTWTVCFHFLLTV